jgi:hypothetical protein
MMKRVLVGLCVVVMAIVGCEDAVSGGSGTHEPGTDEPGPGVVAVTGVGLSQNVLFLALESSTDLTASVIPANAANMAVTWASDNEDVAIVDQNGKVTGVADGNATITVTTMDGGKTAACAVTVHPSLTAASISEWTAALLIISGTADGSEGSPKVFSIHITADFDAAGIASGSSSISGAYKEVRLTGDRTITLDSATQGSLIRTAANQTFVIDGPVLQGSSNNASLVSIGSNSAVELRNGEIKGNANATGEGGGNGGGVYVSENASFTMKGGTVSENKAGSGGGVYLNGTGATFTMEDGTISGNTASDGSNGSSGGGVYVSGNATFTMNGGTISGNMAGTGKKGVQGTFTKNGGTVQDD